MSSRFWSKITAALLALVRFIERCLDSLYDYRLEEKLSWLSRLWLAGIYLLGLVLWGKFFGWGKSPLDYHDWHISNVPRILAVQEALKSGTLPLHMNVMLDEVTDRFFATADVITTPEMVLLLFLPVDQYILVQVFILLTISTLGLMWLRRHYRLSLFAYSFMFLLFNFNGFIQAHFGVGHITWQAYFLFPVFMVLVVQFLERRLNWRWVAALSFLLFYTLLLGGYHIFVWLLIFLGVLGLVCYDRLKWMLIGLLSAGLLSAVRLLPPVLTFSAFKVRQGFIGGYPTIAHVWSAMVTMLRPQAANGGIWALPDLIGSWEYDLYMGLLGAVFLVWFGMAQWYKRHTQRPELAGLVLPSLVLFIFSISNVYSYLQSLPIPLLVSERVTTRFVILPLTVVTVTSAIFFQQWLDERKWTPLKICLPGFFVLLLVELVAHTKYWNVRAVAAAFNEHLPYAVSYLAVRPDPPYVLLLWIGLAITLLAASFLFYQVWRERSASQVVK